MIAVSMIELYAALLMTVPILAALLFILVVATITLLKWSTRRARDRRFHQREAAAHIGPDGLPYPPSDRGMCDLCAQASERIYHPRDGRRICHECYIKEIALRQRRDHLLPRTGKTA